jgi:hypothetical protein
VPEALALVLALLALAGTLAAAVVRSRRSRRSRRDGATALAVSRTLPVGPC